MNIISIDLEFNQPSGKVIQLGYIIANVKNKAIKVTKSIIINPLEELNKEIIKLTGITQEMVDNSNYTIHTAYEEMCKDIDRFQVTKHPLQWGLDHNYLITQLNLDWDEYIFRRRGHDIKSFYQLYQMVKPNSKVISGLDSSMKHLGLTWDFKYGPPHNALADAHNTLLTFWKISDKLTVFDEMERIMLNVNTKKI